VRNSAIKADAVETIMQPAFPFVDVSTPLDLLSTMITPSMPAVLVRDFKTDKTFNITRSDIIRLLV
jgi:predicted transcriptional regulator